MGGPGTFPPLLEWDPGPMVYLHWCRVHNGEFGQLRRSDDGVALDPSQLATPGPPTLELRGRLADSLVFAVTAGIVPVFEGGWPPGRPELRLESARHRMAGRLRLAL